jgi:hypothetical protein
MTLTFERRSPFLIRERTSHDAAKGVLVGPNDVGCYSCFDCGFLDATHRNWDDMEMGDKGVIAMLAKIEQNACLEITARYLG